LKNKLPKYIDFLIKKYPNILSGRKNHKQHHERVIKSLNLIKKYFNKKINLK